MEIRRGEIVRINLNPISGREQKGEARPCLVLSQRKFNVARQGIVVVSPITSIIRPEIKTMLPIPEGFSVHGSVIAEQVRTLDLNSRWWKTTGEFLPEEFVDSVVATLRVIIS